MAMLLSGGGEAGRQVGDSPVEFSKGGFERGVGAISTVAGVAAIRDDLEIRVQKLLTQLVGTPEN